MTVEKNSVYIANLNPGTVRHEFFLSLTGLIINDIQTTQLIGAVTPRVAGGCLGIFRNMAVDHFLASPCEWMFFVDSDIVLKEDTLQQLARYVDPERAPVVCGSYVMALDSGPTPSMFEYRKENEDSEFTQMLPMKDIKKDWLTEVDGTGAGCMLIHRGLLEAMGKKYGSPAPWFFESVVEGVSMGEDFTFCLRVADMGYPVYVHTGIEVGHVKNIILDSRVAEQFDIKQDPSLKEIRTI